jgi:hypothetical protein
MAEGLAAVAGVCGFEESSEAEEDGSLVWTMMSDVSLFRWLWDYVHGQGSGAAVPRGKCVAVVALVAPHKDFG